MTNPRFYSLNLLDADPGPVPKEREDHRIPPFPANDLILKEEAVAKAWEQLARAVRATGDLDAVRAVVRFHIALEHFLA